MVDDDVIVDTSDGFVDFRFPVIYSTVSEGGEAHLTVGGMLLEQLVELRFHIRSGILPNDFSDDVTSVHALGDGITMSLTGVTGLNFARALSQLYASRRSSFHMPMELSFTAVALEGNPANIANEHVKFKLFHETDNADPDSEDEAPDYFEMFFNTNLPLGSVALNEKDSDYRSGVMNSFSPELI